MGEYYRGYSGDTRSSDYGSHGLYFTKGIQKTAYERVPLGSLSGTSYPKMATEAAVAAS